MAMAAFDPVRRRRNERWSISGALIRKVLAHPEPLLRLTGQSAPVIREGRQLDRSLQALLALSSAAERFSGAPLEGLGPDPTATRQTFAQTARMSMPQRRDVYVTNRRLPSSNGSAEVPVRIYRRFGSGIHPGRRNGAILFLHGGGWVLGNLDSHDGDCQLLAAVTGCVVVAVDYRLAPEHPWPAAIHDALDAYAWVHDHADELCTAPGIVGVMGDSAGGNLAAVVALLTRDGGVVDGIEVPDVPAPVAQGLVYPAVDARLDSGSMRTLADGFFLTRKGMEEFRHAYLPDEATWLLPSVSPILAPGHEGLAPALVVTAGFDPLRDEGLAYAESLRAARVPVVHRCYDDQIHGFFGMGIVATCHQLATEVCLSMGQLMQHALA